MKVWRIAASVVTIALVCSPTVARAHGDNSTITGVVRDTSGAVLSTSAIYQNFGGIENGATYTATNAQITRLGQCGAAPTCNATVTVALDPPGTRFEPRLQQVDVRFSRQFRLDRLRVLGNVDVANLFNAGSVLNLQRQFGPTYLNVLQIMGGRLVKLGAQIDV